MAYTAWSVVFGEQPSAAKWNILGTNDATFDALIGSGTAWTSYTPSWTASGTAPAIGNGTLSGAYQQFGKTVHFKIAMQTGSTTTYGTNSYRWTLPVAMAAPSTIEDLSTIGTFKIDRLSVANLYGWVVKRSAITTYIELFYLTNVGASIASAGIAHNAPYTWSTGDKFLIQGTYEAA